jgi:polysaccharide export outer membrane protein
VRRATLVVGIAFVFVADQVSGQVLQPEQEAPPETVPTPGQETPADPTLHLLADRPFERLDYSLGPGDEVALTATGEANFSWVLTVTPEGTLIVPTVGVVRVLGLNLEQAEQVVEQRVLQYYRNIDITLTLAGIRGFKVFVVGAVPAPGPRVASAATRVSELVPPGRNIILQRASGDTLAVDVIRFRQTGDLAYNPTLRSGDVILVPETDEIVLVEGRVFFPGNYEFREGETLAELLRVANGYRDFPSDAHDVVRVTRFVSREDRELHTFSREEATGARGEAFVLQPFDAVFVPRVGDFKVQKTAAVEGEVRFPGTYPIRPDTTTVSDLIEIAGGVTEDASLAMAALHRRPVGETERGLESLEGPPPEVLSEDERRILRVRQLADSTSVVIDLERTILEEDSAYDVSLRDGDVLTIPERRQGVTVLGAVLEPGIVSFAPDREVDDYVRLAGGYTNKADEGDVVVLKGKTETILERGEIAFVEAGDTIIVPFEVPRDWWEIYGRTTTVITGILSIILTYIAATR